MAFDQGHALVIGIGSYAGYPQWDVPITADDARAVAATLRDPRFCGYHAARVSLLHDGAASRPLVLAQLDALARTVTAQDTVLLFYGGHGAFDEEHTYYLTTSDTRFTPAGQVVAGTGISEQELLAALTAIKAHRMLLLFNACHAGLISPTLGPTSTLGHPPSPTFSTALLTTGEGRLIITACRANQVAYIGDGPLTIFTTALVEGLRGEGDMTGRGGFISAFDLYGHVYARVVATVEQWGARQEPELTVIKGVGPFAVALYNGAADLGDSPTAAPLPPGAVREVLPQDASSPPSDAAALPGGDITIVGSISHVDTVVIGRGASVQTNKHGTPDSRSP